MARSDGPPHSTAPFSTSTTDNWIARAGSLPGEFRQMVRAIMDSSGKTESEGIRIAWGVLRNWAQGRGGVGAKGKAKAIRLLAELDALRAKAHAGGAPSRRDKVAASHHRRPTLALAEHHHKGDPPRYRHGWILITPDEKKSLPNGFEDRVHGMSDGALATVNTRLEQAHSGSKLSPSHKVVRNELARRERANAPATPSPQQRLAEHLKTRPDFDTPSNDLSKENAAAVKKTFSEASERGVKDPAEFDKLPGAKRARETAAELNARKVKPDTGDAGLDHYLRVQHDLHQRNGTHRPSAFKQHTTAEVTHGSADRALRQLGNAHAHEAGDYGGDRPDNKRGFVAKVSQLEGLHVQAQRTGSGGDRFDKDATTVVSKKGSGHARQLAEEADAAADYLDMSGVGHARPSRTFRKAGNADGLASSRGASTYSQNLRQYGEALRRAAAAKSVKAAQSDAGALRLANGPSCQCGGPHDCVFYSRRSTPAVIHPGDPAPQKKGYGRVVRRRKATDSEEADIKAGRWIRVDHAGNTPTDQAYAKSRMRPHLATKTAQPRRAGLALAATDLADSGSGPQVTTNSATKRPVVQHGAGSTPKRGRGKVTAAKRRRAANQGNALADGSLPIENRQALLDAITAFPRLDDAKKPAGRKLIKRRARELGMTDHPRVKTFLGRSVAASHVTPTAQEGDMATCPNCSTPLALAMPPALAKALADKKKNSGSSTSKPTSGGSSSSGGKGDAGAAMKAASNAGKDDDPVEKAANALIAKGWDKTKAWATARRVVAKQKSDSGTSGKSSSKTAA